MPRTKTAVREGQDEKPIAGQLSSEDKDRLVEIWKKAVETQMHFNEMSGKSRQLGLTFVAASLGVAVVMLARGDDFALAIMNWQIHVGVLLILAAILALWGVRQLDLGVYHRMLRGAVTFGEDFEKNYMRQIFDLEKGMTQAISHFSRHTDAAVDKTGNIYNYIGKDRVTAEEKIKMFYYHTKLFLLIAAASLLVITNFTNIVDLFSSEPRQTEIQGGHSAPSPERTELGTERSTNRESGRADAEPVSGTSE